MLRTTRILETCLSEDKFEILRGRKFIVPKFPQLEEVYNSSNSYVLYPSSNSISLDEFKRTIISQNEEKENKVTTSDADYKKDKFHVIVIDGTWPQASGIFFTNQQLHKLKQVTNLNHDDYCLDPSKNPTKNPHLNPIIVIFGGNQ